MFSEKMIRFIKYRLAIIKYSGCAAFHWDLSTDKLVLSCNWVYWTWCLCYYGGMQLLPFFFFYLYDYTTNTSLDSNETNDETKTVYKNMAAFFMVIIASLVTFTSLVVSILKEKRMEVCAHYNGCFQMDRKLKSIIISETGSPNLLLAVISSAKKLDVVATFACIMSLVPPVVMTLMMFHPIDAMHTILEEIFELPVKFQPRFILIALSYGWSCLALCNTIMTFTFMAFLCAVSCTLWTQSTTPTIQVSQNKFETVGMGVLSCDRIISIYRCHQVLCSCTNTFVALFRYTLHFALFHILAVSGSFLIIKYLRVFIEKDAMELIAVFFMFVLIAVVIIKCECMLAGMVVDSAQDLRKSFLNTVGRKHYAYKAARSFQTLYVKTTYPLFSVSNDTFLEFLDVAVDHIVNLLCT